MRLSALTVPALLLALGSCASSSNHDVQFVQPNQLVGGEIESRIANIPLQHREDLLQNLLWLSQQGEQAINALLQGMQHQEPKVRSSCSWTLGRIGDRRVVSHLRPYMRDQNETVRLEVARTLLSLGDMDAVPVLVNGLDSNKKEVRYLCHESLKGATGRDFGFDHLSEDLGQRRLAVLGWRQWWSEYSKDPWFAQSYAKEHNITDQPAAPMGESVDPLAPPRSTQNELPAPDPLLQDPVRTGVPTQTTPAGTTPPETWPTGTPTTQNPNTGTPTTTKPVTGKSTTETPGTETVTTENPTDTPATGTATGQTPAGKTSTGKTSKAQTPAGTTPAPTTPAPKPQTEPKTSTTPSTPGQTNPGSTDGSRNR